MKITNTIQTNSTEIEIPPSIEQKEKLEIEQFGLHINEESTETIIFSTPREKRESATIHKTEKPKPVVKPVQNCVKMNFKLLKHEYPALFNGDTLTKPFSGI